MPAEQAIRVSRRRWNELERLWRYCHRYVDEHEIGRAETVEQCDLLPETFPGFVTGVCEIVGYHHDPDADEGD